MPHADPEARRAYFRAHFQATKDRDREVHALNLKNWRKNNPEKRKASYSRNGKVYRQAIKQFVAALKNHPCIDCGHSFPSEAMDFDHRPGETKAFSISGMGTRSKKAVLAEVQKCDLVCACCHRIRTARRARAKLSNSNGQSI